MIRNLIVIAVASFVLTVACVAGVAALGGRDLVENGWSIPAAIFDDEDNVSISISPGRRHNGPDVTRELGWSGGTLLEIDLPADVTYTQGPEAKVTVSGPQNLVDRIVVDGGRLRFRDDDGGQGSHVRFNRERIHITVVAPGVRTFVLNGSPDLTVAAYDQPDLAIEINGSGEVEGAGKTQALSLTIAGSGDAGLGALAAQDATISIAGSGNAEVAAKGAVQVDIAGSGDVVLTEKPASLSSNIDGSGDLRLPE
ncbi:MAG: DUF2807 domain-containing protein [Caulobacterales bacterium]|nr:DUF2807 domain-containing protein [Caulobacterales bacterium]